VDRGVVKYPESIYFWGMKILSLKLDDDTFEEAEKLTAKLSLARNRYINEAVKLYNHINRRRILKTQLAKESGLTAAESLYVIEEFDNILDD
jgi:hypothetical protein